MPDASGIDLMDTFPVPNGRIAYDAFVKLKLVHAPGQSVLVPDILVLASDQVWLQPEFFSPPILSFYQEKAYAHLTVDVADERLIVGLTNDRHVRALTDARTSIAARSQVLLILYRKQQVFAEPASMVSIYVCFTTPRQRRSI